MPNRKLLAGELLQSTEQVEPHEFNPQKKSTI